MPIQRTLPKHDPTSPEALVAKARLDLIETQKKSIELENLKNLIIIVCVLVLVVFAGLALMTFASFLDKSAVCWLM